MTFRDELKALGNRYNGEVHEDGTWTPPPVEPPPPWKLPRLPVVVYKGDAIDQISGKDDPREFDLQRNSDPDDFLRDEDERYEVPAGDLLRMAQAALDCTDAETVKSPECFYVVAVDPTFQRAAWVVEKIHLIPARAFLAEWQSNNPDWRAFIVHVDSRRLHCDDPRIQRDVLGHKTDPQFRRLLDDPLSDQKNALEAELNALLAGEVEIEYAPTACYASDDDEEDGDAESVGNLYRVSLADLEFDYMGLDLRDGDLGPQIVSELRRVGQKFIDMAMRVSDTLTAAGREFVPEAMESEAAHV